MNGFMITNMKNVNDFENTNEKNCRNKLYIEDFFVSRNVSNKFIDDKLFEQDTDVFIILDGVIFNRKKLITKYRKTSWFHTVKEMALSNQDFFNELRGEFAGAIYYKKRKEWSFFTSHFGTYIVFYYVSGEQFFISTRPENIYRTLKKNRIFISLDKKSVHDLLTFGGMEWDNTICGEVKRLLGGECLSGKVGGFEKKRYYMLEYNKYDFSDATTDELIEELDRKYRRVVVDEFEKDLECGYKHLVTLSGGMDSRMVAWLAYDMGYKDQLNLCFGLSDCLDHRISEEIAKYMNTDYLFVPNDKTDGTDIKEIVYKGGGMNTALLNGAIESYSKVELVKYGAIHTGQSADVLIGTYAMRSEDVVIDKRGFYGRTNFLGTSDFFKTLYTDEIRKKYPSNELYWLYTRQLARMQHIFWALQDYGTYVVCPTNDIDMAEFCLSLPTELRLNRNLYKKWIIKKYPEAEKFRWASTGLRLSATPEEVFKKSKEDEWERLKCRLEDKPYSHQLMGMSPLAFFWRNNDRMHDFMEQLFDENIGMDIIDDDLRWKLRMMFEQIREKNKMTNVVAMEKIMVLTVLCAIRQWFY